MHKKSLLQRAGKLIHEDGWTALAWKILWKLPVLRSLLLWRFVTATKSIVTPEDALEFAFSRRFGALITPSQIQSEIQALCEIIRERRPRTVLEIGTGRGGTFFMFSRVAAPDASLISVDMPTADLKPWRSVYAYLGMKGQKVSVIDGDSHAASTVDRVDRVLGGRKVDFLFIDGDHAYEGVKKDFETYSPFMEKGGIVAFHDINRDYCTRFGKPTDQCGGEVYRFWAEVNMKYPHLEFISNSNEDGFGIGVLFIK